MRVSMLVASDDDESGSVMAKHERISPFSSVRATSSQASTKSVPSSMLAGSARRGLLRARSSCVVHQAEGATSVIVSSMRRRLS